MTTEQEKLLGEKTRDMEEIKKDLDTTRSGLKDKEEEVRTNTCKSLIQATLMFTFSSGLDFYLSQDRSCS